MKKIIKKKSPLSCSSENELATLIEDNFETSGYWIITDGINVSLNKQKLGHSREATISIPRKEFNLLVKWYIKSQPTTKIKRK